MIITHVHILISLLINFSNSCCAIFVDKGHNCNWPNTEAFNTGYSVWLQLYSILDFVGSKTEIYS